MYILQLLQGQEIVKDFDWLEVPPFSRKEFDHLIKLYTNNGWISRGRTLLQRINVHDVYICRN